MKRLFGCFILLLMTFISSSTPEAASTSVNIPIVVTAASGSLVSIALSNNSTTTGLSSGTAVGTLSVSMSPASPIFAGYTSAGLTLTPTVSGCNGADNASFQIVNDQLQTNGTLTAGTKNICVAATQAGATGSPLKQNFAITVGNLINATTFCAANGGGDGSSGSPWQDTCIQAAVNAASSGDTVFLASGNWALNTQHTVVTIAGKAINLVGAGSGNTFDAYGRPNNANGNDLTATTSNNITRIFTTGPNTGCDHTGHPANCSADYSSPGPGGSLQFGQLTFPGTCNNVSAQHIFMDGANSYAGGDRYGTMSFLVCTGLLVNDVRALSFAYPDLIAAGESQFNMSDANYNVVVQSSVFANPNIHIVSGNYPGTQVFQDNEGGNHLIQNNYFFQFTYNPIYVDSTTFTGNQTFNATDSFGNPAEVPISMGMAGCWIGPGSGCATQSGTYGHNGTSHWNVYNSYFYSPGENIGIGVGVNDPSTSGGLNDINLVGNTIIGNTAALDSCEWHVYDTSTGIQGCTTGIIGMQVNGTVNSDCTESDTPSDAMTVTNNTVTASVSAQLNASGTGTMTNCQLAGSINANHTITVVNYNASQNYLTSPDNAYVSNANTHNPNVTNNFCAQGSNPHFSGCLTSGFTSAPTASFALSPLGLGGVVPFSTTNFTAQYGAVQWLASTSPTTPSSGDTRWSFVPPFNLSAAHGNTVYLWVMDSANHISSPATSLVP